MFNESGMICGGGCRKICGSACGKPSACPQPSSGPFPFRRPPPQGFGFLRWRCGACPNPPKESPERLVKPLERAALHGHGTRRHSGVVAAAFRQRPALLEIRQAFPGPAMAADALLQGCVVQLPLALKHSLQTPPRGAPLRQELADGLTVGGCGCRSAAFPAS